MYQYIRYALCRLNIFCVTGDARVRFCALAILHRSKRLRPAIIANLTHKELSRSVYPFCEPLEACLRYSFNIQEVQFDTEMNQCIIIIISLLEFIL